MMEAGDAMPVSVAEAKAYLRIEGDEEDALIAGLIRVAAALCEAFTGLVLIERATTQGVAADGEWRRLTATPVVAIDGVSDSEIGANGDGWVRLTGGGLVTVSYRAGMAEDWNGVPEPLRQGMMRLVAHMHAHRDAADDAGPPAAVAALWRPWRWMRLA